MEKTEVHVLPAVIHVPVDAIAITPRQVARYAGGKNYRAGSRVEKTIADVIDRAGGLVDPAIAQTLHAVSGCSEDGLLLLENGLSVEMPFREREPSARHLVTVVCTLGPALEEACREFVHRGDALTAALLDAAGVAALESLSDRVYELLCEFAGGHGLSPGCRIAPGCMDMPMSRQAILFELVDGGSIGVRLNRSMVMEPGKSLSFFLILADGRNPSRKAYKCGVCQLAECSFRVTREE